MKVTPSLAILLSVGLLAASPAAAKTIKVPAAAPVYTVTLPDDWTVEKTGAGFIAESKDEEATIAFESADGDDATKLVEENIDWLTEQGVTLDIDSQTEGTHTDDSGIEWNRILWSGTSKEWGPAAVGFVIGAVDTQVAVITYWVTTKGFKRHEPAILAVLGSVKPVKK